MARHELWVELADMPGNLAALAGDLASCGANIVHLDVLAGTGERADTVIDRLVIQAPDQRGDDLAAVARRYGATLRSVDEDASAEPPPRKRPVVVGAAGAPPGDPPDADAASRRAPMTLERLVALPDGGLVRLRHLSTGDSGALAAQHGRCSEDTRRHSHFLSPAIVLEDGDTVALAALVGDALVGVGRYDLHEGRRRADLSVVVEDRHQRRGIGSLLVNELATLASNTGVTHLRAVAPAGGDVLARTLRHAGLEVTVQRDGEALIVDGMVPLGLSASA